MANDIAFPFDSGSVMQDGWSQMARLFAADGVVVGSAAPTLGAGLTFQMVAMRAMVRGFYYEMVAPGDSRTAAANTSTNPRIDRLVLRLDRVAKTISPRILLGTPAASPQPPALADTATATDLPLSRARCPGSGSPQNYSSIVDERKMVSDDGPWMAFTPTGYSDSGTIDVGDGYATGRYFRAGRLLTVSYFFSLGSSANAGKGPVTVALPAGMVLASMWQYGLVKIRTNGIRFAGYAQGNVGDSRLSLWMPVDGARSWMREMQSCDSSGRTGTGVPAITSPDRYTLPADSDFAVTGTFEVQ